MNFTDLNIGERHPAFLIAEVAQAHDGSLGLAHSYIDAAADAGADAVKFQTHMAAAESTLDEPFRVKFSRQDETRYAYWQRMEFTPEQWAGLAEHAREKGLTFLSSPFSVSAVELLSKLGVKAWKIGSGEVRSADLLEAVLRAGGPILLSTGMSDWAEIDQAVNFLTARNVEFAVMQCTSRYPTPYDAVGLNVLQEMKRRYDCPVGLSDHSGSIFPPLASLALGVDIIETHIVFDKMMFGPDTAASLTVDEFRQVAEGRDAIYQMRTNPVDKNKVAQSLREMRNTFGKSLALKENLPHGTLLGEEMLTAKKPGTGIPLARKSELVGRRLRRDVPAHKLLCWEDIE